MAIWLLWSTLPVLSYLYQESNIETLEESLFSLSVPRGHWNRWCLWVLPLFFQKERAINPPKSHVPSLSYVGFPSNWLFIIHFIFIKFSSNSSEKCFLWQRDIPVLDRSLRLCQRANTVLEMYRHDAGRNEEVRFQNQRGLDVSPGYTICQVWVTGQIAWPFWDFICLFVRCWQW